MPYETRTRCGTGTKRLITTKNKDLSAKLVTDVLRGRLAREVQELRIGSMPIVLRRVRDQNAQSFFKVALVDKPNEPIGEILSEGEHRCVALAAFLAELVTSRDYSGIVFDDPMSPLDHRYRRRWRTWPCRFSTQRSGIGSAAAVFGGKLLCVPPYGAPRVRAG